MEDSYSIIVRIPKPTGLVHVASPFSKEFLPLRRAIVEAVTRAGLAIADSRQIAHSRQRFTELFDQLRSASLIVGVCSPEPLSNQANPNVMYELGLAHSIGKPTIILTSDISSLPSNVADWRGIIVYDKRKEEDQELVRMIKSAIHSKMNVVQESIIDASYHDMGIWVSNAPPWLFKPEFWENFVRILSFGVEVQHYFETVQTMYLDQFLSSSEMGRKGEAGSWWRRQWNVYNTFEERYFSKLSEQGRHTSDALEALQVGSDLKTYAVVDTSKKIYDSVSAGMSEYERLRQQIAAKLVTRMGAGDKMDVSEMASLIQLKRYAGQIRISAGSLNLNVLRLITERA